MNNSASIRAFIVSNFYVPEGTPLHDTSSLMDLGIVDSTGVLEITAFLESNYEIVVADDEIVPANMDSIEAIASFVDRKRVCAA